MLINEAHYHLQTWRHYTILCEPESQRWLKCTFEHGKHAAAFRPFIKKHAWSRSITSSIKSLKIHHCQHYY